MSFLGLSLAELLTLFGVASATTIALYLLRLRRVDVEVPFVALFEALLADRRTTAWLSKRTRWLSLLLALLIVATLVLALGDPRATARDASRRTLVALVDVSASMQATDIAPSRLARAKEEAKALVRSLGPNDRMMIVAVGARPSPRSPLTSDAALLDDAIESIEAEDVEDDLPRALRFARDALRGEPHPEVVWLSDHAEGLDGVAVEGLATRHVHVGSNAKNVGIAAFAVRRYPLDRSQAELLVELENTGSTARRVELEIMSDARTIDVEVLTLPPRDRTARFLTNVAGANARLEARIRPVDGLPDYLPADDRAFARIPERARTKVLVVSQDNLYLEAALLLDELLDVTYLTPEAYTEASEADVVVFDGFTPRTAPSRPAIYLSPLPGEGFAPFRVRGTLERPAFERIERRDPLLRFTALADVNIARALAIETAPGDRVLGADRRGPLLVTGTREGQPFVALTFDVRESDLPLRIAWPLLLLHAIEGFTEGPDGHASGITTGRVARVRVETSRERLELITPRGAMRSVPVIEGHAVVFAEHAGFHTLRTEQGDQSFAASLSSTRESAIASPPPLTDEVSARARAASDSQLPHVRAPWTMLVLLGLALLALEWVGFHRRWTV